MYDFPCLNECELMRQVSQSFIRILHASPKTQGVDIYANGKLIARNLVYKSFTPYLKVPAGEYTIRVYPTGKSGNPIIDSNVSIPPNTINTIAATGIIPNAELYIINEPRVLPLIGRARVRFVHLSPDTSAVDVSLPGRKILFPNVSFKGITKYTRAVPGRYNIQLKPAGANNIILTVPNIKLSGGKNYTIYAIGLSGDKPGLQLLVPLDGNTYL